ncbi:hypothetical protein FA95DRAFT_1576817 [Auriscalpium vulgare]|uniref:Uncharacterized protein n=2 Tax=Auriscalpium vulgare TaxID=40419 RepID=A0ACB8R4H4_9AGAM|nr:hypothetical protein FA95DRAFT_1577900 [Auriscalpium vulgare]KAI0040692.1 hypothetical protein FA95DRAFT_1576817 [Auriscalpium vulgare]
MSLYTAGLRAPAEERRRKVATDKTPSTRKKAAKATQDARDIAGSRAPGEEERRAVGDDEAHSAGKRSGKAKQVAQEDMHGERGYRSAEDGDAAVRGASPDRGAAEADRMDEDEGGYESAGPAPLSQKAKGRYVEESDEEQDSEADEDGALPETDEVWVEPGSDEEVSKGSRLDRKFKAGVPQWEGSDDASAQPLSTRERELEALADAEAPEFDFVSAPTPRSAPSRSTHTKGHDPKGPSGAARKTTTKPLALEARSQSASSAGVTLVEVPTRRAPAARMPGPRDEEADGGGTREAEVANEEDGRSKVASRREDTERGRSLCPAGTASQARTAAARAWPAWTNFMRVSGARLTLGDQSPEVREVISDAAADEVPYTIAFESGYPDEERRVELLRDGLIRTAQRLNRTAIAERLRLDEHYMKLMVKIPEARVSNYRKKFKEAADDMVQYMYNLEEIPEEKYVQRMQKILAPKARWYIFPGSFQTAKVELITGSPYCHPAIINVMHEVCFGPRAKPRFPRSYYVAIAKNKEKPELPRSMVAMAATAIEAGLKAFALDPKTASHIDFSGDIFGKVYEYHWGRLRRLKRNNADAYSVLMAQLYDEASKGRDNKKSNRDDTDDAASSSGSDSDDFIDLDAFGKTFGIGQ